MQISSELLSRLSSAILRLYAPAPISEIPKRFFGVVRDLIECEHLSYNEFGGNNVSCILDPIIDSAINEAWIALVDQHPTINYITKTNTTQAVKISDFLTAQQWRRTALFNEVFEKLQVEHQLGFMFSIGDTKIGFAANRRRRRDFSEIHRFILSFLASHLSQAIQNSMAMARIDERMHHVADLPSGGGVIVFSDEGTILFCSRKAADCVNRFFEPISTDKLPEELCRWFKTAIRKPTIDEMSAGALHPFTKEISSSVLTVRLMPNYTTNEHTLVLQEEMKHLQYSVLQDYGLTCREAEVLNWVTQGKTNPEIAIILDISVKTVGHHIEHIMSKLGVERRGAAALWAQQTIALHA